MAVGIGNVVTLLLELCDKGALIKRNCRGSAAEAVKTTGSASSFVIPLAETKSCPIRRGRSDVATPRIPCRRGRGTG